MILFVPSGFAEPLLAYINRLAFNSYGPLYARAIAAVFGPYRQVSPRRFRSAA